MRTKEKVLARLEEQRGQYLSGADLARGLAVSRNAVWKAVGELKKDGHDIEAVTNKGYCLSPQSDVLSLSGLLPYLPKGQDWTHKIHIAPVLASTNQTAKDMAHAGAPHGTTVIAGYQTEGRGRYARVFASPPGGLYMSFVLRPEQMAWPPAMTTIFAAAAVCQAVEVLTGKQPQIKWVNDIFLDGKKIGGILTEAVADFETQSYQWVVLGIGLNFRVAEDIFPRALREIVGTVYQPGEGTVTQNQMLGALMSRIFVPEGEKADSIEAYRRRLMGLGKPITVQGEAPYAATMLGVTDQGHLLVRRADGTEEAISSGEILL